jgi:hypothetical protein
MVDPKKPMAIVSFNGTALLNVADATKLFEMLCNAEYVDYDWSNKGYKRKDSDKHNAPSLQVFTVADYATLALNSTD